MAWISRLRGLFQREKVTRDLDEELEFHLSMREQWNVEHGMPETEARRAAKVRFGNPALWRERMSAIDLMLLPESILQDLRFGARMLWRNAGFTAVAVLALATGIGVNTATVTAKKAFFQQSLDARDPGRMVNLALTLHSGSSDPNFSYLDYKAYRDHVHSFSGVVAEKNDSLILSGADGLGGQRSSISASLLGKWGLLPHSASDTELASTAIVSENYFSVLGVEALRGRIFVAEDAARLTAFPSVLISENYWQKRFAGDPAVLGKSIRLNGASFTIVGITPHDFAGTSGFYVPDVWMPLSLEPLLHVNDHSLSERESECCRLFARLAPGVGIRQAQAEMNLLADHLRGLHDPHAELSEPVTALVWPGSPFPLPIKSYGGLGFALLLIMVAVGMVLVIACANVASLQMARSASRQNELAMRLSLGASRLRLVRQLLTESALLGLLAGIIGLLFAWGSLKALAAFFAASVPVEFGTPVYHLTPDPGVFAYTFAISLVAGVLFGLAPALESSRAAFSSALKATAGTPSVRGRRFRDFLIVAQVAGALVLMIAGSMLVRNSIRLVTMNTGYESKHVVELQLKFPESPEYTTARELAIVRELRRRLATLPGVAIITTACPPGGCALRQAAVSLNGEKPAFGNGQSALFYTYAQENYFQTLSVPLLFGHGFGSQTGPSVILSESAARQLWPGQNPLGRSLRLAADRQVHAKDELPSDGPEYEVIGVARDTRGAQLDDSDSKQIYVPLPDDRLEDFPILVRTQTDPAQLMDAIAPIISAIDPYLVAYSSTLDEKLHQSVRFNISSVGAMIASTVGLMGLLLASMGIYGTVSYIVVLRTREVGIRMALGAGNRDILGLILRESTSPVAIGLFAGACLAVGVSYLLRGVLYGIHGVDGVSFAGVSLLFLAIALLAAYVPSRRAMSVDPVVALRYE